MFTLSSIACALSPNAGALIAARVLQGAVAPAPTRVRVRWCRRAAACCRAASRTTPVKPAIADSGPVWPTVRVMAMAGEIFSSPVKVIASPAVLTPGQPNEPSLSAVVNGVAVAPAYFRIRAVLV
ncbi:hypothetical protein [Actinomadura opuntiae]|uniref:hypothetical protein n=1 Tax=Actinomadura sp. OS1-43 TaxID=604315 RepID=UPI00255B207C|nr:hypothetical protein [Actinomadura sp. OS1-43]MDL4820057.1 hypothetical protein [Actinomadura sp. OS1-43]